MLPLLLALFAATRASSQRGAGPHRASDARRWIGETNDLGKVAGLAVTGHVAPWFAPVVAAAPSDVDTALWLAPATGGASLGLLSPRILRFR